MHPWYHAVSSARRHGGKPEDYLPLHNWFDASKEFMCDFRHRALRHHAQGIFEAEREFGPVIFNSVGRSIPTRLIGEQHVREDLGRIPTLADWLRGIKGESWMFRNVKEDAAPKTEAVREFAERTGAPVIDTPLVSPSEEDTRGLATPATI